MSKAYMPFYIGDYMADVGHLSHEYHGPYIFLLCRLWLTDGKPLPKDPEELREICRIPTAEIFTKIWSKISKCFIEKDNGYIHKRIAKELRKYKDKAEKCRRAGSLGGKRTLSERSSERLANAKHKTKLPLKQSESESESESVKDKDKGSIPPISPLVKIQHHEHVHLTEVEHGKLVERFGQPETEKYIERLNNYIGSKGKKYKSHYHTILSWRDRDDTGKKPRRHSEAAQKTLEAGKRWIEREEAKERQEATIEA